MLPKDLFQKHTRIGLDLDETLASTFPGMIAYAHQQGKLHHIKSPKDITKHDASWLGENITHEEACELWEGYGQSTMDPLHVPLVDGAHTWVHLLLDQGKECFIVTARSDHEAWKLERTLSWMQNYFPHFPRESVHFVNHFSTDARPKSAVCRDLGITLMIDDAIENAYELCENGIACILLEQTWNQVDWDHPLLYRAKWWGDLNTILKQ